MTHLAPQLYLCLLFKSHHGYRRSFSTLQPVICLWRFQTARGFLSEVAILLCSWKCPRKHHKASEGRTAALLLGPIRGFSHCLLCLSSGQGFLQAGKLLLILYLLNKVEFLCVMLKMLSLFYKLLLTILYNCCGLFVFFFDIKVQDLTIIVAWILSDITGYIYIISNPYYLFNWRLIDLRNFKLLKIFASLLKSGENLRYIAHSSGAYKLNECI